jgi:hypothetical protein
MKFNIELSNKVSSMQPLVIFMAHIVDYFCLNSMTIEHSG